MSELIKKLNKLKEKKDWDDSALEVMDSWKTQLDELELDNSYLELPQSKKIAEYFTVILKNINRQLMNDKNLSEIDRAKLFALKDIALEMLPKFSSEENKRQITAIEDEINENFNN